MLDFLAAIEQRSRPVADIEQGHISTASCILANLAMKVGRTLSYDPQNAGGGRSRSHRAAAPPVSCALDPPGSSLTIQSNLKAWQLTATTGAGALRLNDLPTPQPGPARCL